MKKLLLILMLVGIVVVAGCVIEVTKYQCSDGSIVEDLANCPILEPPEPLEPSEDTDRIEFGVYPGYLAVDPSQRFQIGEPDNKGDIPITFYKGTVGVESDVWCQVGEAIIIVREKFFDPQDDDSPQNVIFYPLHPTSGEYINFIDAGTIMVSLTIHGFYEGLDYSYSTIRCVLSISSETPYQIETKEFEIPAINLI